MIKKMAGLLACIAGAMLCICAASAKDAAPYHAFAGRLRVAVEECGLYEDTEDYWDYYDRGGVAYAALVDFNGDGQEELFYMYGIPRSESYEGTIYQYRYAVWGYENGSARQLVNAPVSSTDSIASMIRVSLCPQDFGYTYLETFDESEWLAATYSFSTYMDGVWKEVSNLRSSWYEQDYETVYYYQLNGETISEGYFRQLDAHYRKQAQDITPADFSGAAVERLIQRLETAEDTVDIYVNGTPLSFESPSVLLNDTTMVPIRAVGEAMGCDVVWDGETGSVIIVGEGLTAVFDGAELLVNDTVYTVTPAPVLIYDTTYLPVRVLEYFGASVEWRQLDKSVWITY